MINELVVINNSIKNWPELVGEEKLACAEDVNCAWKLLTLFVQVEVTSLSVDITLSPGVNNVKLIVF